MNYTVFDIRVGRHEDRFVIDAGPADSASHWVKTPTSFSISRAELDIKLLNLRQQSFTEPGLLREIGEVLHGFLFPPVIRDRWTWYLGQAGDAGLLSRLDLDDPYLESLPWELVYDAASLAGSGFLSLALNTPLARLVRTDAPPVRRQPHHPQRLLIGISVPPEQPQLDVAQERAWIQKAIRPLVTGGVMAEPDVVEDLSRQKLQSYLLSRTYDIIHYIGHGKLNMRNNQGQLILTDEEHGHTAAEDAKLLGILARNAGVGTIVLNACLTAASDGSPMFRGVAQEIARAGVPIVVAMQFSVADTVAAVPFARFFYEALAQGQHVLSAMTEGRKAILGETGIEQRHWAAPVVYLREVPHVSTASTRDAIPGSTTIYNTWGGEVYVDSSKTVFNYHASPVPTDDAPKSQRFAGARAVAHRSPRRQELLDILVQLDDELARGRLIDKARIAQLFVTSKRIDDGCYHQILIDLKNDSTLPDWLRSTVINRLDCYKSPLNES